MATVRPCRAELSPSLLFVSNGTRIDEGSFTGSRTMVLRLDINSNGSVAGSATTNVSTRVESLAPVANFTGTLASDVVTGTLDWAV